MPSLLKSDGIWTWFNWPVSVYSSVYDATYTAWVTAVGSVGVAKWYETDQIAHFSEIYNATVNVDLVGPGITASDDHNAPAVIVLRADGTNPGKVLVCYGAHAAESQHYSILSSAAGDIRTWRSIQTVTTSAFTSYSNLFQANDSSKTIYWFYREGNSVGNYAWKFHTSTDGETWSAATTLTFTGTGYPQVRQDPADPNKIHWFINDVPPANGINTLYHFYISIASDGTRTYYKSDGTSIGGDGSLPLSTGNLTTVRASVRSWSWDANVYSGTPVCLYAIFDDSLGTTHTYKRSVWSGSAWNEDSGGVVGGTGGGYLYSGEVFYSGGCCLDPNDQTTMYASVKYGAADFRLEKHQVSGGTWSKVSDVSGNTGTRNCRPRWAVGSSPTRVAYWNASNYVSYGSYTSDVYTHPSITRYTAKPTSLLWTASKAPTGIQHYWPLQDGTGTTATDLAGSYNGTLTGTPTWANDASFGYYLTGLDSTHYAGFPSGLVTDWSAASRPKWIAVTFANTDTSASEQMLFCFSNSGNNNPVLGVSIIGSTNTFKGWARNDAGTQTNPSSTNAKVRDGLWHTIYFVMNPSNTLLYFDGAYVTYTSAWSGATTLDTSRIGHWLRSGGSIVFPCISTTKIAAVAVGWGTYGGQLASFDMSSGQFAGTRGAAPGPTDPVFPNITMACTMP